MNRLFLTPLALMIFLPHAAFAGCYSNKEIEAEQGIRIHSELMIIGLNCQHMATRNGENPFGIYKTLTAQHADLFAEYETTMISYYKASGAAKPEASLNTMRTNFANKISHDAATMRPDIFCAQNIKRMDRISDMSREDLKQWAGTFNSAHPVSQPVCASAVQ
ncbi:MAG: hypothetical protein ACT4OY_07375 [Alphaproteobacteria bacterium]